MLGGGTSPFRDRGDSAFRLLLHDTSFRHVAREATRFQPGWGLFDDAWVCHFFEGTLFGVVLKESF